MISLEYGDNAGHDFNLGAPFSSRQRWRPGRRCHERVFIDREHNLVPVICPASPRRLASQWRYVAQKPEIHEQARREWIDAGQLAGTDLVAQGTHEEHSQEIGFVGGGTRLIYQLARRASRNCSTRAAALSCEPSRRCAYRRFEVSISA
jgi:hypothetical protein